MDLVCIVLHASRLIQVLWCSFPTTPSDPKKVSRVGLVSCIQSALFQRHSNRIGGSNNFGAFMFFYKKNIILGGLYGVCFHFFTLAVESKNLGACGMCPREIMHPAAGVYHGGQACPHPAVGEARHQPAAASDLELEAFCF